MNKRPDKYVGIDNDINGGMTNIGKIIRDAWVFELLPESETCEGWNLAGIDALLQKVNAEWDKYGCMVSQLPDELRHRKFPHIPVVTTGIFWLSMFNSWVPAFAYNILNLSTNLLRR